MSDLIDKMLVNPFMDVVNSVSIPKKQLKIIRGVTGLGKTYTTLNTYIPYMFKEVGAKLVVFTIPQNNTLDRKDASEAMDKHCDDVIVSDGDITKAILNIALGKKVLLIATNQLFLQETTKQLLTIIKNMKYKCATIHDEIHSWSVSCPEHYHDAMGHRGNAERFGAKFYKAMSKWAEYTPYTFGLTATPHAEQKRDGIPMENAKLKYAIINEVPSKQDLISRTAYVEAVNYYGTSLYGTTYGSHLDALHEETLIRLKQNQSYQFKNTMMVIAGPSNTKYGLDTEAVLELMIDHLDRLTDYVSEDDKVIAVMTSDKDRSGFYTPSGKFFKAEEDEIIDAMRDQNHKATFLIVVSKGQVGMNIYNLKSLVVTRIADKEDSKGRSIIEAALQVLGRMVRICPPTESLSEYIKKYDYDLTKYIKSSSTEDHIRLLNTNSIRVSVPCNSMWNAATQTFLSQFSTVDEAREWIMDITQEMIDNPSVIDEGTRDNRVYLRLSNTVNEIDVRGITGYEPECADDEYILQMEVQ